MTADWVRATSRTHATPVHTPEGNTTPAHAYDTGQSLKQAPEVHPTQARPQTSGTRTCAVLAEHAALHLPHFGQESLVLLLCHLQVMVGGRQAGVLGLQCVLQVAHCPLQVPTGLLQGVHLRSERVLLSLAAVAVLLLCLQPCVQGGQLCLQLCLFLKCLKRSPNSHTVKKLSHFHPVH